MSVRQRFAPPSVKASGPHPHDSSGNTITPTVTWRQEKQNFKTLGWCHAVASFLHLASFLAILVVREGGFKEVGILGTIYSDVVNMKDGTLTYEKVNYELVYLLLAMVAFTGLVHVYQFVRCFWFKHSPYRENIKKGINRTRWSEYTFTAGAMTWILCQLCGITNIYALIAIAGLGNVLLQWQGYFFEVAVHERDTTGEDYTVEHRFWVAVPMLRGFLIFLAQWVPITLSFSWTLANAEARDEEVPVVVPISFGGILFFFLLFPIVQTLYSLKKLCITNWFRYELAFIVLSLTAKMFLTWTMFGAV